MAQRIFKLDIESGALGLGLAHGAAPKDGIFIPHGLLPEAMAAITRELIAPHLERQDDQLIELTRGDKVREKPTAPLAEGTAPGGLKTRSIGLSWTMQREALAPAKRTRAGVRWLLAASPPCLSDRCVGPSCDGGAAYKFSCGSIAPNLDGSLHNLFGHGPHLLSSIGVKGSVARYGNGLTLANTLLRTWATWAT